MKLMKICDMKTLRNILEQGPNFGNSTPIVVDPNTEIDTETGGDSVSGNILTGGGTNDTESSLGLTLPNIGGGSSRQSKVGDLILSSNTESINIAKKEAKEDADEYTRDHISIESASTSPTNQDRVVLVGKTLEKDDHFFPVEKGPSGKYGWINNDPGSGDNEWNDFTEY